LRKWLVLRGLALPTIISLIVGVACIDVVLPVHIFDVDEEIRLSGGDVLPDLIDVLEETWV